MPTMSIDKSSDPGQETGGGQLRLPLSRLRLPVQPSAPASNISHAAAAPYRHGAWPCGWRPVDNRAAVVDARSVLLRESRSGPEKPKRSRRAPRKAPAATAESDGHVVTESLLSPVDFARKVLGVRLWEKQEEVLTALTENRRVAVKAGNGLGKGFCAAVAVLWFLYAHQDQAIVLIGGELSLHSGTPTQSRPVASQGPPFNDCERPGNQAERPQPTGEGKEAKGQGPRHLYQVPT